MQESSLGSQRLARDWTSREFDYGIGDEVDMAVRQVRNEIAAQIRREAKAEQAVFADHAAYETAARIAEGVSWPPSR